jgi:hypothetical protein
LGFGGEITLRRKIASPLIFLVIAILISISLAHATNPAQQNNKTLISLTHSGTDPVGFMLYTMVKHQIDISDNFQLSSDKEIPIIRLELITFDPDAADTEQKDISSGYASIWTSTEGFHIMAAAGVCGRDRLTPVADEIVAKTQELIPTAQQHNAKSSQASLQHFVAVDVIKENDELRDWVAELQLKVNALEMELAAAKGKSWWERLWGD